MPKGSPELTASRREEIVSACEKLYKTMSFKDITLKEISVETSFSRPSIYNYFRTKEEIFLALMQREYENWAAEVNELVSVHESMSAEGFAAALAHSLEKREQLLKLLAMNHYDMEENSRP
ncbi:MAG TPA: TetR family transcriptional regulator, partial [Ruminococcus sp.]|nr:TetR family transcriptional regulator [Ruminococcus sp.]